jgi:hypothetical protein
MYYIEQYGEFYGPMNFERALKLCGHLNFVAPDTAMMRDGHGDIVA